MKKLVIVAFALLLMLPALSYAGSATSRWDMTIGGYVAFDYGYANQQAGADYKAGVRESGSKQNIDAEFNNWYAKVSETRLNFLVLGPDAFGAKTRAFIEYDFQGSSTGGSYVQGGASLRHAYVRMDWANDQLLFGEFWTGWLGGTPPLGLIGWNLPAFGKSNRVPQMRWTHQFGPTFKTILGIEYQGRQFANYTNSLGALGQNYVDAYTRSDIPNLFGVVEYTSGACGKIGPQQLLFGAGGYYGRAKYVTNAATGVLDNAGNAQRFSSDNEDSWSAVVYTYIPIIPEKNNNKAGALGFTAGFGWGQNGGYENPWNPAAFQRPDGSFVPPAGGGFWAGAFFYFTDSFFMAPTWSTQWMNVSNAWRNATVNNALLPAGSAANPDTVIREDMYNLAFFYDVNPALRFGAEFSSLYNKFAAPGYVNGVQSYQTYGTLNTARFRVTYFF
ncbi:MAG TPA: hypothetical protein VMT62_09100 [Syntrophorhabdaceae bacterium]|nr:hypothetical protein [Syntrophorhabdaceae bacterium]